MWLRWRCNRCTLKECEKESTEKKEKKKKNPKKTRKKTKNRNNPPRKRRRKVTKKPHDTRKENKTCQRNIIINDKGEKEKRGPLQPKRSRCDVGACAYTVAFSKGVRILPFRWWWWWWWRRWGGTGVGKGLAGACVFRSRIATRCSRFAVRSRRR